MLETISYKGKEYPKIQSEGFASQYTFPFAHKMCKGVGLDIGYMKKDWKLRGAYGIDPTVDPTFDALNLPNAEYDYIFSSHCLEHVDDWVAVLDYWRTMLKPGGILFLYLPHYKQEYWRPWNNMKHKHIFTPDIIRDYLQDRGWNKIFVTEGYDLNYSFYAIAEK